MEDWKIIENLKEGNLGTVNTSVTFDRNGALNLSAALFLAGALLLFAWYVIKKKLI